LFGATDIITERGEEAMKKVRQLTGGYGVHSVLIYQPLTANIPASDTMWVNSSGDEVTE